MRYQATISMYNDQEKTIEITAKTLQQAFLRAMEVPEVKRVEVIFPLPDSCET